MYLLDTNVVSETRRARPHGAVLNWIGATAGLGTFIPAVVLGELQQGIELARPHDPIKAAEIQTWLDAFELTSNILAMDGSDFRLWARLMHGKPPHLNADAMIAATAINRGLTVATRNVRDFEQFGVALFNPFAAIVAEGEGDV